MSEFIRVRDKGTGHEFSIPGSRFDAEAMTKLDKPALGPDGEPVPVKHKTTVAKQASAKKASPSGQKADPQEES